MERIEMSQEERDKLEWLKRAKDGLITVMDPISWTKKDPSLDRAAALKMKESQCLKFARVTHPA
jgi:hypothetical protein